MTRPTTPHNRRGAGTAAGIADLLNEGVRHHQEGRFRKAARLYSQVLKRQPKNPDALHLLGLLAHQDGDSRKAQKLIGRAIAVRDGEPLYHNNFGIVLAAQDRHEEAVLHYRKALDLAPDYLDAMCNLANAFQALDRHREALDQYRKALSMAPDNVQALNNLGVSMSQLDRDEDAASVFRRGLAIAPKDADLHRNLGLSLQKLGLYGEALSICRAAVSFMPDNAEAHLNLGNVLQCLNRHDEAVECFQTALALAPDDATALNNLGNSLASLGQAERSIDFYRRATEAEPENADFHSNLANALHLLRRLEDALPAYQAALMHNALHPNALSYAPHVKREMCDWAGMDDMDRQLLDHVRKDRAPIIPFPFLAVADDPALQMACAVQHQAAVRRPAAPPAERPHRAEGDRIRVGYISEMFRSHPLSYLIVELLEQHDRSRFDIVGFSYGRDDGSPIRRRVEAAFDAFHDIRQESDDEAAHRIRSEKIDILVDLNGYTESNRLPILARRPAPVQAHYLGYPGTLGAGFVDYLFVDAFIVPPGEAPNYSEHLVYLPHSYQVNDRKRAISETVPTRADCGLPEQGFVFCTFNQTYKITPSIFDIWIRLLREVPDSVLWLLRSNDAAEHNLRREARRRDVDPARLVFAPRAKLPDHLARLRLADLFLDTLPVNAHTTASDALWAGLPVLTCPGRSMAARVAGSLLRAVGLPELVAENLGEYESLARRIASEPDMLAGIKARLAANRETEPLFDTERFRRGIETAYERIWETAASGRPPASFTVSPDG